MNEKITLIEPHPQLSIRHQVDILEVNRSSLYYQPIGEAPETIERMKTMDKLFINDPTLGVPGIRISMDGRGRATDNTIIERWFRTIKQKHIYLNPAEMAWNFIRESISLLRSTTTECIRESAGESHLNYTGKLPE